MCGILLCVFPKKYLCVILHLHSGNKYVCVILLYTVLKIYVCAIVWFVQSGNKYCLWDCYVYFRNNIYVCDWLAVFRQ